MKIIFNLLVSGALIFSAGIATAETETNANAMDGFHAFSQITSATTQVITALTDEQLSGVVGGWNYSGTSMLSKKFGWFSVTQTGNPPKGVLFATETGNPNKGWLFGTQMGNPPKQPSLVIRLNRD